VDRGGTRRILRLYRAGKCKPWVDLPRGEDVIDRAVIRCLAGLAAAMTAVILYMAIHGALGVSRRSILIDSLAGAGLLGLVCVGALLKERK
jgi:hypothetical protein